MGFNEYITNERAVIMIAHTHFLAFSLAAAFGPKVLDSLTLANGESDEVCRRPPEIEMTATAIVFHIFLCAFGDGIMFESYSRCSDSPVPQEPAGFMPAIQPGLTASAELLNGETPDSI
uniref:Uncharacterized protein n=1 Tax=Chrysotila carterae TaxID=13221 RepID=A0A7S4B7Y6_CHRCT